MATHLRPIILIGLSALAAVLALLPAHGQAPAPGQTSAQPYRPGMGDFMTAGIQPRHIKLAAAGQVGNWDYAAYALKEMGESFDRVVRTFPTYRNMPTVDLIANFAKQPMAAVDQAIQARDADRFKTAYLQLTQACNGCHQATDRATVVIQVPHSVTDYPDQNFSPAK